MKSSVIQVLSEPQAGGTTNTESHCLPEGVSVIDDWK